MNNKISQKKLDAYDKFYHNQGRKDKTATSFSEKSWNLILSGWNNIKNESNETKRMAEVFFALLEHKLRIEERSEPPSEEEVKEAIKQLKDVGRIGFFASVSILPGGALSLLGLELLAKKFGIKNFTFIPSSFRRKIEKENDE